MLGHELMLQRLGWSDAFSRVQVKHLFQEIQGTGIISLDIETAVLQQILEGLFDPSLVFFLGLGPFIVRKAFAVGEISRPRASDDLVHRSNLGRPVFSGKDRLVEKNLRHEASKRKDVRLLGISG